jgi:hypothetical protein
MKKNGVFNGQARRLPVFPSEASLCSIRVFPVYPRRSGIQPRAFGPHDSNASVSRKGAKAAKDSRDDFSAKIVPTAAPSAHAEEATYLPWVIPPCMLTARKFVISQA